MGKRSDRRIFRRRRQRAGLVLVVSLVVVALAATAVSRLDPFTLSAAGEDKASVHRIQAPKAGTPKVEQKSEAARAGATGGARDGANEKLAPAEKKTQEQATRPDPKNGGSDQARSTPAIPTPPTNDLWMDVPDLGLNDVYITNSDAHSALDAGATKLTSSAYPWQSHANTYIVGHRLGWPGTASDHLFYNLPLLSEGAKIYLYDDNGTVYTYAVTSFHEVDPSENWITAPQAGRDMISLQTCIENYGDYWTMGPDWLVRYVVQADRVSVTPG